MSGEREGRARLPSVDAVLRLEATADLIDVHGRRVVTDAVRAQLSAIRSRPPNDIGASDPTVVLATVAESLESERAGRMRPVINATGVVLHTNLGRAPLSEAALAAVNGAAGYATVEFDLASGVRGGRAGHASRSAAALCGAEEAVIVNNGAAALMLGVAALASGREVIVSRGELVEIGGSFRLPEIIATSGARLVEVGTTNRTRAADYRAALGPETALILKVHRSNFRITGFTEEADASELARLAADAGVPFVYDVGSGRIALDGSEVVHDEPSVRAAVAAGADMVMFSGDKLLGGPQAGIIVGRSGPVGRCRVHPMMRAVRADKLQIAALEATLAAHLRTDDPADVPVIAMLTADVHVLQRRAEHLASRIGRACEDRTEGGPGIPAVSVGAQPITGAMGGGAAPDVLLPSHGVALTLDAPQSLQRALRAAPVPVVARVADGSVWIDMRTVPEQVDATLADAVVAAIRSLGRPDPVGAAE